MTTPESKAASVALPAPPRLAKWATESGFTATIVLTRTGETSPDAKDPGADPGPIDDPIESEELEILRGLLNAYDIAGKRDGE